MHRLLALSLLLAACGGDDKDTTSSPTDTTAADTDTDTDTDSDSDTDTDTDSDTDTDTDTDTDSDTDTDTDTDTDSSATGHTGLATGTTADTGPVVRDGIYTGTLTIDAEESGFVVNYDSCVIKGFELTVDSAVAPTIQGEGSCQLFGGQPIRIVFGGDPTVDPMVEGEAVTSYPTFGAGNAEVDVWTGGYTGPDTLTGQLRGDWQQGSAGLDWTATFTVTRP